MKTVKTTKHIFVTGGVVSSLGKGLTASSLGMLLTARGLNVVMQKLDPYLNVDPGTMNPFQHGEVFVTEDGGECDLDVGHYERFLNTNLTKTSNITTGQVYSTVIKKERAGEYLGQTVQVIPHITDEISSKILALANKDTDVVITEVGGTIGDIEGLPFLEAIRQVRQKIGKANTFFLHASLVPYIGPAKELKTKPTQHSVAALRNVGIIPDALVLRSDRPLDEAIKRKIAFMCDVDEAAVVGCPDAPSIYNIPKTLHSQGLDAYIVQQLRLPFRDVVWTEWTELLKNVHTPQNQVEIALVGKYIDLPDAYLSVVEALYAGGFATSAKVTIRWVASDKCTAPARTRKLLEGCQGLLIPGGFGVRGIEGKLIALQVAREDKLPTLGICLGMQSIVIEAARNLAKLENANSLEFDPTTLHPVITVMNDQKQFVTAGGDLGGTMRLGSYSALLTPHSLAESLYASQRIEERHRHRFEVNNNYRKQLEKSGLVVSGVNPDTNLVEFVELPQDVHPFYIGTQAHPEFKSRPTQAHPLFKGLIAAALEHQNTQVCLRKETYINKCYPK